MRSGLVCVLLLCMVTLYLSGCSGAQDTDQIAYVLALGLDKSDKAGEIIVTYQIAIPQAMGGEVTKGGEGKSFINTSVRAPSLAESRSLANSYVSRNLSLVHLKAIIVGEDLARDGVSKAIAPMMRFREYRGSMYVMVTRGKAFEFLAQNDPKLESIPSKYYEVMFAGAEENGFFMRTNLHRFYDGLKSGGISSTATLVGVSQTNLEGRIERGVKVPGQKTVEFYAGETPSTGENPVSFLGLAVFRGDKMVGMLTNEEARIVNILLDHFPKGFFVLEDPLEPKSSVNVHMRLGDKPKIDVRLEDGHPIINIKIFLEGEITSIASGINYEQDEYRQLLEAQVSRVVKEEILATLSRTREWGTDVAGFGRRARGLVSTNQEFKELDWLSRYEKAEFHAEVSSQLRRTGLMRKTLPIIK